MADGTCSVIEDGEACAGPIMAKGLCDMHYKRQWRHGHTGKLKPGPSAGSAGTLQERFATKVEKDHGKWGCWRWTGATHELGYGRINDRSTGELRQLRAHVIAWEWENGPVPDGKELDHYLYPGGCIGPRCCNPEHVRPVTHQENCRRAYDAQPWNERKDKQ